MPENSESYEIETPAEGSVVGEINANTHQFRNLIAAAFGGVIILYFLGLFTWKVFAGPEQIEVIDQVLNDSTKLLGPILGYCIAFITKNDS